MNSIYGRHSNSRYTGPKDNTIAEHHVVDCEYSARSTASNGACGSFRYSVVGDTCVFCCYTSRRHGLLCFLICRICGVIGIRRIRWASCCNPSCLCICVVSCCSIIRGRCCLIICVCRCNYRSSCSRFISIQLRQRYIGCYRHIPCLSVC